MVPDEGCPLGQVVLQGCRLVPVGSMSAGLQDPPPGNGASVMAQHGPDLPGASCTQQFGDVPIGDSGSGRDEPDDVQHCLHVLNPH